MAIIEPKKIEQELLHQASGAIYLSINKEVIEGSDDWVAFQAASDPVDIGYIYITLKSERDEQTETE